MLLVDRLVFDPKKNRVFGVSPNGFSFRLKKVLYILTVTHSAVSRKKLSSYP
jgi:hypothetical protein